jgi:riboflavin kinase / FMN adenylyltransferase
MTHLYQLEDAHLTQDSAVTIGVFDGVHLGHQTLLTHFVAAAHDNGRQAVVVTFYPHPDVLLRKITGRYYLTTLEQKADLMLKLGVDLVVTHPFNDETRQMRASVFVDRLIEHLQMKAVWVGADFALGYQREGNVAFLREQGQQRDFTVEAIDLLAHEVEGEVIRSTAIREAVQAGDMAAARKGLGRSYAVRGKVVTGQQRGRTIGFPTANIAVWEEQLLPPNGVYAGWASWGDERHMAVTNIGVRPTFDGQGVTVETYLLDYEGDLYGKTLDVTFEERLRPEMKFNGLDALIAQIKTDVETSRTVLA